MGGFQTDTVNLLPFLAKRIQVTGSTLRNRSLDYKIRLSKDLQTFAWEKFATKEFRPIIDAVYDWKEVVLAHTRMENNENIGKIVLTVG